MVEVEVLMFGACTDITGERSIRVSLPDKATVRILRQSLESRFEELKKLNSLMVAVNSEYAQDEHEVRPHDEIALIPPVSGG